jgi:hypothetical protein
VIACFKAVSQLLWPDKDREEWFSLGENHEKGSGFGSTPIAKPAIADGPFDKLRAGSPGRDDLLGRTL